MKYKRDARRRRARLSALLAPRAHPGSDASVEGEEDAPRYSPRQLEALGRRGLAFRKRDGSYGWGCADRRDLLDCVAAFNRGEAGSEAAAVKRYLKLRAVLLRAESLLPASWQRKRPT